MANALTNTTDTIITDAAIEAFDAAIAPLRAFAVNASPEPAQRGDKVKVLQIPLQDAGGDFVAANGYVMQDADATGLDITLNKHKYVSWALTDQEIAINPQVDIEKFGRQKGFQLAKLVIQDIWSLITNANFGAAAFTGAAGTFDADDVVDIRTVCATADWPEMLRSLVLKETYVGALLKDNAIQDSSASGMPEAIQDGAVNRISGFDLFESTLIPANGENLVGFAVWPSAILVAMRYLMPQEGNKYFQAAPITAPDGSGFTLGFRDWYDENYGQRRRVLECIYGYAKGDGAALKRLVSA
jgi:hypothetical protein